MEKKSILPLWWGFGTSPPGDRCCDTLPAAARPLLSGPQGHHSSPALTVSLASHSNWGAWCEGRLCYDYPCRNKRVGEQLMCSTIHAGWQEHEDAPHVVKNKWNSYQSKNLRKKQIWRWTLQTISLIPKKFKYNKSIHYKTLNKPKAQSKNQNWGRGTTFVEVQAQTTPKTEHFAEANTALWSYHQSRQVTT